ncbi:hypothetical protein HMPREF1992_01917 [Selenomonas sp. oral taxon 892 str. F0426]|nr:hypothetical protein HMPREF1992_01917 [Selenomonas sp. oral taxon 892 str. F0426]
MTLLYYIINGIFATEKSAYTLCIHIISYKINLTHKNFSSIIDAN